MHRPPPAKPPAKNKEILQCPVHLGYLVPEFPTQTHNFFWKEIESLRSQGVIIHLLSTKAPAAADSPHPFCRQAVKETTYLFPPSLGRSLLFVPLNLISIAKAAFYILSLPESNLKEKIRLFALIPSAIELLHCVKTGSITHIHCHSCANAAHLVSMARLMGGPSYSLSLHGHLPVYGHDHRQKMAGAKFVACVTKPLQTDVLTLTPNVLEKSPAGSLDLLTVARLNRSKGIEHAIRSVFEARKKGYEITYSVAGEGPDRERLEALIHELNLGDYVHLLGTTGESEIIRLLQQVDAFILPSVGLGEAAPVSVMEAMACGVPVICSRIGGTPDMISDGIDGFLTPQGDEAAILSVMERLAADPELRRSIGTAARERAEREFTHHSMAKLLLEHVLSGLENHELKLIRNDSGFPFHPCGHHSEFQNTRDYH